MTRGEKQMKNSKPKKVWVVVSLLLAFVLTTQLVVSNVLAGRGGELAVLETASYSLAQENQFLKQELATKTSLLYIESQAEELGFGGPDSIIYIDLSLPVASLPQ
ncbi:hypothetical protein CMO96_01505 [Candidatus Woesebacteria bacterium]|nr:hypothetical protein [Candidatus Woesebacteria bacterium]|tara:strand:- start:783 stop:1097 length:315 start_codon:yes stop_codon:yes gene_type:complete